MRSFSYRLAVFGDAMKPESMYLNSSPSPVITPYPVQWLPGSTPRIRYIGSSLHPAAPPRIGDQSSSRIPGGTSKLALTLWTSSRSSSISMSLTTFFASSPSSLTRVFGIFWISADSYLMLGAGYRLAHRLEIG